MNANATLTALADRVQAVFRHAPHAADIGEHIIWELRLLAGVPQVAGLPLDFTDCMRAFLRLHPNRPTDDRDPHIKPRRLVCQMLLYLSAEMTRRSDDVPGSALKLAAVYRAAVEELETLGRHDLAPLLAMLKREIVELEVADYSAPPSARKR